MNGYAETLKPSKPRSTAAAAAANRPYAPIRRVDDEGQIPEIEMFVGESRVFPTPGVGRIAVGNGAVLTAAALDNKEVIVFANQVGTSSLFIWNADGRYQRVKVNIVPGDTARFGREIAAFLSTIPKAKASIVGANVIVEGDELSDADMSKIDDLAKRYPQIVNFTNRVGWEQMVLMDVKVVEFPITYLRDIGFKWNATGGGAIGGIWSPLRRGNGAPYDITVTTGTGNAPPITAKDGVGTSVPLPSGLNVLSALNLGLNAQLNLLAQEGKATLLAEPQLSARNGSKASFIAGGEIPYSVQSRDGLSVLFKPYGVKLDITPKVDHRGVIRATVLAEVSSIDRSLTTLGGPALLTRRTETEFNLRNGETIVLAGLLQRELSTDIDKVPLLGDIPVLGALFRSKRYQNKETEMVVFVTPTIVDANSAATRDRVSRTTDRLQERLGANPYLSEPVQPGVSYERPNAIPQRVGPEPSNPMPQPTEPAPISKLPAPSPTIAPDRAEPPGQRAGSLARDGSLLRVVADEVVMRDEPNAGGAPRMQHERGAVLQLGAAALRSGASGTWRNVVLGALNGWVPANSVAPARGQAVEAAAAGRSNTASGDRQVRRPLSMSPERAEPKALTLDAPGANARVYKVARDGLALRVTPDVNAEVVARPAAGAIALALPHTPRGGWTAVQIGDGATAQRGWIASQWLMPETP